MDRRTDTFTQMGGEGASWIGQAPFTDTRHIFQNIGDGTYFHSGLLAIRATIAAKVNITYKLLFNDAVAMTGGQPLDGALTVPQISQQLHHEGASKIVIVSDDPGKYPDRAAFAPGVSIFHRRQLDQVQKDLTTVKGTSILIYDQTCAAELRRRRKRGKAPDPATRVFINELICEGCGDCSTQSNCLSVLPQETEFGRKRKIDQSSCNKDLSCLNGFCPSFVVVVGGELRPPKKLSQQDLPALPEPKIVFSGEHYGIVVTGIGGTGVVTVGALLGMAAHLEAKGCAVLDMTGLAQKYGAVVSHVTISDRPEQLHSVRIPAGKAKVLIGCDFLVAGGFDALSKLDLGQSHAVVNSAEVVSSDFIANPDVGFPVDSVRNAILEACGQEHTDFVDANRMALALLGDSIGVNLFMVGYAWQKGLLPLQAGSIERAIELNAVAVEFNKQAFNWGRHAAHNIKSLNQFLPPENMHSKARSTAEMINVRADYLAQYQNKNYRDRYLQVLTEVQDVADKCEAETDSASGLTATVARNYFKLLAYKDEYEVARLLCSDHFTDELELNFSGDYHLEYSMAPPWLTKKDSNTGRPVKIRFGSWVKPVFALLAKLKILRATVFDPFAYSEERKLERQLIKQYEETLAEILPLVNSDKHDLVIQILNLPDSIRGFGPVKLAAMETAEQERQRLLQHLSHPM